MTTARKPKAAPPPPPWWHRITRDLVLFAVGIGIVLHQTLVAERAQESILIVAAGMMGLPVFFRRDESGQ